eukprot:scaffold26077_cov196-Cylindrotheca_fusiformis.AAC.1
MAGEDDDQAVRWSASRRTLIRDGEDNNQAVGRCNKRYWCNSSTGIAFATGIPLHTMILSDGEEEIMHGQSA